MSRVYGIAVVRTLRAWRSHMQAGDKAVVTGMLWALIITAIILALPVIVGALVPQHPAP
jgi:hypothetical protein